MLRRRPSRGLRDPARVERALAEELLSLVAHPFDRGAVGAGMKPICARVGAACAEQRVAPRAPPACWSWSTPSRVPSCFALSLSSRCSLLSCLRAESLCAVRTTRANPCMVELDSTVPEPCGAIGETEGPSRWRRKGSFSKVGVPW